MKAELEPIRNTVEDLVKQIRDFEKVEARYTTLLRIQPIVEDDPEAPHRFNSSADFQDERHKLLQVCKRIFHFNGTLMVVLPDLEETNEGDDFSRAKELRFLMLHTMVMMHDRLLSEVRSYESNANGQRQGMNVGHIKASRRLATNIDKKFGPSSD
ncbi:hypothetical protein BGW39_009096 [Mortierella sp. 14UC]|nr:hypothetical protein BGW39_009096 [Mortierella sp. 14UC]